METMILKNGVQVHYDYRLVPNGAVFYVNTKLDAEEKKEFRGRLESERDVVKIHFS